jgi:uncharacterized membrane protein
MADSQTPKSTDPVSATGARRWLPRGLVVVASLLGLLAVFALWAERQLLDTDNWVDTSSELLEREAIREALAGYLVDQLYESVDVEAQLAEGLPKQVAPLAGPVAGGLRQVADQIALRALESDQVKGLWEGANRGAHELFVQTVEGGGDRVSTEGGAVTIDLTAIVAELAGQIGLPAGVAESLPPEAARLEILDSDELSAVQDGVDLLETVAVVLVILTFGLYALAIYLARGRRRETLRAVGISFVLVGLIVLFVRSAAGDALVNSLTSNGADEPAVADTWDVATSLLATAGGAVIVYGLAFIFSAWLAGPSAIATGARGALAPYLRQPQIAYGGLAVLLILLFWWSPVPATQELLPALILIGLLVFGTEVLRRMTIAEFPDRVTRFSAAGLAQTIAGQTRDSIARRSQARIDLQQSEASTARLAGLERIAQLRESGVLSEQEAASEKARLLGGSNPEEE